ncbi:hypothetical protein [Clostridium beijerinckii]|uniref:hypothetical protein n=1 Tax=Clostridium beijerinckii TaxID=1520 RepID=UPI00157031D4|nr:hypothetical protein [Clostridium beijerinckii]NRU52625.1 hypothetical protein [Clostridium beijerinckii]NYC68668.1 hypothetical protein [Clostridium beijerinckii]NYC91817.1 hypothetical protein [Clostridium beijerinckii]
MQRLWKVFNLICGAYWLYLIYDSFVSQSITNLRSTAICGSIVTAIWFFEQTMKD